MNHSWQNFLIFTAISYLYLCVLLLQLLAMLIDVLIFIFIVQVQCIATYDTDTVGYIATHFHTHFRYFNSEKDVLFFPLVYLLLLLYQLDYF